MIYASSRRIGELQSGGLRLSAIARPGGESIVDTFNIAVFDGTSRVTSLVAGLMKGLNDSPVALADALTTPEKTLLESSAPSLLTMGKPGCLCILGFDPHRMPVIRRNGEITPRRIPSGR